MNDIAGPWLKYVYFPRILQLFHRPRKRYSLLKEMSTYVMCTATKHSTPLLCKMEMLTNIIGWPHTEKVDTLYIALKNTISTGCKFPLIQSAKISPSWSITRKSCSTTFYKRSLSHPSVIALQVSMPKESNNLVNSNGRSCLDYHFVSSSKPPKWVAWYLIL